MDIKEAKEFLNNNGFILEDTDTNNDEYQKLKDEWETLLHKNLMTDKEMKRKWEVKRELDALRDINDDLEDKIVNAKSFNIQRDIPKYEKELIERLEEMGIKLESTTPVESRNTIYNFIYKFQGSIATMSTQLSIEQGNLMVECKLFSDEEDGLSNIYYYCDTFFSVIEEEKEDFERKVKKKNTKKKYWIEVDFGDDDPAFDAISGLKNFKEYNIQKQWNDSIDDVNYEMVGNGTVRVEGNDKDFLNYLVQFISETDMDSVIGTKKSWRK